MNGGKKSKIERYFVSMRQVISLVDFSICRCNLTYFIIFQMLIWWIVYFIECVRSVLVEWFNQSKCVLLMIYSKTKFV